MPKSLGWQFSKNTSFIHTTFSNKKKPLQNRSTMSLAPSTPVALIQPPVTDISRPCATFPPTIWGDVFLQYDSQLLEVSDNLKQQAQILKEETKKMFQSPNYQNLMEKLNLIDLVQRLGVSNHFQQEINQALEQMFITFTKNDTISEEVNHHSFVLLFRLLRQQGYQISSATFEKFKNDEGKFNETLINDVQGLCSLYEAAQLRTHKDDILEEACDFSKIQLKFLANQLDSSLAAQINHCLMRPFNKSVTRFEARYHMTLYEQDPSHDKTLLTFAKVDFNNLQKMYQKEISSITKWWKNSNFAAKVPYARDRLVEGYLWSLAVSSKLEHSSGRMSVGKFFATFSLVDDTYDAYGTVQELELFTEAILRWDISLIGSLPDCMKAVFDAVVEMCEEVKLETIKSGKPNFVVSYVKQAVYNLIKCYMVEARWCHEGYIPTYDEYKVNGFISSGIQVIITLFIGLGEFATEDVFEWIFSDPDIIKSTSIIGRVLDDIGSHEFEQQREHVASSIQCCMKQYGISEMEAYNLIHKDVEHCWKVINEECLKLNDDIPKFAVDIIVNLARSCEFIYENKQDKFTNIELLKDYVSSQLVDPIPIDEH